MESFRLPEKFLMGVATASLQIEGGDTNNSWYRWCRQRGRIADGATCDVANDHWNRIDTDIALMQKLNVQTYRLSLEWSRIEPRPGHFDAAAMAHYREEIKSLLEAGIQPLVSLHHFSNPLWLEDAGAWTNPGVVQAFEAYTDYVAGCLGDLVNDWVTINEPNVYLAFGYIYGVWPPGQKYNLLNYFRGARNMIAAHIAGYRRIHKVAARKGHEQPRVGVAHHLRIFEPASGGPVEKRLVSLLERLFHEVFVYGMFDGRLLAPVGQGYPFGTGQFQDFFGINYYTRDRVTLSPRQISNGGILQTMIDAPQNDLGWELYPSGLYHLCRRYYQRFKQPIFILENGTCDQQDAFRARFIYDHLAQIRRLIDDGIDIQRYYHWTLMDNFEWAEGLQARFGLIHVDYETQERTVRPSGRFFGDICKDGGVTDKSIAQYL